MLSTQCGEQRTRTTTQTVNNCDKPESHTFTRIHIHETPLELAAGESYVLDNEHLIAWDNEIDYTTRRIGGLNSTLLSGEGLVFEFTEFKETAPGLNPTTRETNH